MSGKKMDWRRAYAVLEFNYSSLTVMEDPDWAAEMVDILTADPKADKREVCKAHGLKYPPKKYMDWYFSNTDAILTYDDLREMWKEGGDD